MTCNTRAFALNTTYTKSQAHAHHAQPSRYPFNPFLIISVYLAQTATHYICCSLLNFLHIHIYIRFKPKCLHCGILSQRCKYVSVFQFYVMECVRKMKSRNVDRRGLKQKNFQFLIYVAHARARKIKHPII